jgi:hypothetical protein
MKPFYIYLVLVAACVCLSTEAAQCKQDTKCGNKCKKDCDCEHDHYCVEKDKPSDKENDKNKGEKICSSDKKKQKCDKNNRK